MQNNEFFENYGTETWAVEQNLCFMLQEYWETIREQTVIGKILPTQLPLNPIPFVKDFMKKNTLVEVEYAEKSKLSNVEKNVVYDIEINESNQTADFEVNTSFDDLNLIWPDDEDFWK